MIGREPNVLIASMGGVASTAFMEFFARQSEVVVNDPHGLVNPWKHALAPPRDIPSVQRAVFLFGCPYDGLLSLFQRGYAAAHYVTVSGRAPQNLSWPGDPWKETCRRFNLRQVGDTNKWRDDRGRHASEIGALDWFHRHKAWVETERQRTTDRIEAIAHRAFRDLDDYLHQGEDYFRWKEQLDHWTHGPWPYQVLRVRYETLWDHLPEILAFLRIPIERAGGFPPHRQRSSNHRSLPSQQLRQLERLYGSLKRYIDALPDLDGA